MICKILLPFCGLLFLKTDFIYLFLEEGDGRRKRGRETIHLLHLLPAWSRTKTATPVGWPFTLLDDTQPSKPRQSEFCEWPFHIPDPVSFEAHLLFWSYPTCPFFSIVACAFSVLFKTPSPKRRSWGFPSTFSLKSLITLAVTFRYLIHFQFNFIFDLKVRVQLHSFACGYPVVSAPFLEQTILFPLNHLGILIEDCYLFFIWIPKCKNACVNFMMNFLNTGHLLREKQVLLKIFVQYASVCSIWKVAQSQIKPAYSKS